MSTWKKEIIDRNLGEQILFEYRRLLSVGKSGEEAENLLVDYFRRQLHDDNKSMGRFWLMLALYEWEFGRLTQNATQHARKWAMYPWDNISKTTLENLLSSLDTPMPKKKKVRLPSYVSHCPWPVGSLLAYRIISSEVPRVKNSEYYGKYVLLRVIKIKKTPVTRLAPEAAWNECMIVGLYNWIGDSIPDPQIVDNLQFTAVSVEEPSLPESAFSNQAMIQSSAQAEQFEQIKARLTQVRVETCCDLDWKCVKGIDSRDVFTYLGCDPSFAQGVSPFFKTDICDYAMCHSLPFDAMLVNRFAQLSEETKNDITL